MDNPEKQRNATIISPAMLPIAGLLMGCFIWVIDTITDVYILGEEQGFMENLTSPDEASELWMRILIVIVFIIMGFFSGHILKKQILLDNLLIGYQKQLEDTIAERTQSLIEKTEELEYLANTDPLTGLLNRRKFTEILDYEFQRFNRYNKPFSLINIDIDYFKKINDNHGHDVGDMIIKHFSQLISSNIRKSDSVARWGGEEFLVLLIETEESEAVRVSENLRKLLLNTQISPVGVVTASFGVTQVQKSDTHDDLLKRSDKILYIAKDNGRNRIETL